MYPESDYSTLTTSAAPSLVQVTMILQPNYCNPVMIGLSAFTRLLHAILITAEGDPANIQVTLCHSPVHDPPMDSHLTQSKKPTSF